MILVDSSIWVDVLAPVQVRAGLRERVAVLVAEDQASTTGMVVLELLGGARTEKEFDRLGRMISTLRLLFVSDSTWKYASRLAFDLRRNGLTVPYTDLIIASVAIESGAVLLHRDRHFDVIANHAPLQVESYVPS